MRKSDYTKIGAIALVGAMVFQSQAELFHANLLDGMNMQGGVGPTVNAGKETSNTGPMVLNGRDELSTSTATGATQVPKVESSNVQTVTAPTVANNNNQVTTPDTPKPQEVPANNANTPVPNTEPVDNETGSLPDQDGDYGEGMGDGVTNPLKVAPIDPAKNPASDNWLTREICKQTGVSDPGKLTQEDFDKVTEIKLNGQNLKEHPKEIVNLFNVITLDLADNQFAEIPELRNMTKLATLNLSNNRLTKINLQADLASIKYVYLNNNELSNANNIGSFVHVQVLDLSNNRMTHIDDVAECKTLRNLNVANNHITNINCMKDINEIEILNLGFNRISDLAPITRAKTLKELYVNNNMLTDLNAIDRNNVNLTTLNFSSNKVSSLENIAACTSLQTLIGDNNYIQDIHPLDDLTNLTKLSLDSNQIYDNSTVGKLLPGLADWSVRDQRIVTETQKAINGDLDVHNIVISQRNRYLDPNVISDSGRVNRNIISWKNLGGSNPNYGFGDDQFTGTVEVPINNWENTPCPILGADNIIIKEGQYFDPLKGVTAFDREDGDLKPLLKISGTVNVNEPGEYQLIYRVTDSDGLTSEIVRIVRVVRDYYPVIEGADDIELMAGADFDPMFKVTAHDVEDGDLTYKLESGGDFNKNHPGEYELVYSVTDLDQHVTRVTRTVTVIKNTAPQIVGADDVTIKRGTNFDPKKGVEASDAEDGILTSVMAVGGTVDVDTEGVYNLTYTVSDRDGNQAKVTRTVRVVSDNVPVIENCERVVLKVGDFFDPKYGVNVYDKEDGNIKARLEITGTVDTKTPGTYELTYKVTDDDNNTTTVDRTVVVLSNDKPVISGASDVMIDINKPFDPLFGVTAFDTEDKDLTDQITVDGTVDIKHKGDYRLTYSVKDKDGNITRVTRKVTVVSNKPPIIHGVGGSTASGNDGSTGSNVSNGNTNTGNIPNTGDGSGKPVINFPWAPEIVNDVASNVVELVDNVKEAVAPGAPSTASAMPSAPGSSFGDIVIPEGSVFDPLEGVSVSDDNDANLTVSVAGTVDTSRPGTYTLVYSVTDSDGNTTKVQRTVTVRSNRAPQISWTKDIELRVNEDFDILADVTVTDDNDPDLKSKLVVDGVLDTTRPGTYRITYSVRDSDNNETKKTRIITVRENTAPKIVGVDDIELELDAKFDPMFGVSATDDKDKQNDLKVTVKGEVDTAVPGEYKLIYSCTDSDGERTDVLRKVTVIMPEHGAAVGEMPYISGTTDLVLYQGDYFDPMQGVKADDRQDGDITGSIKIIGNNVNTNCLGIGIVIYEVSDSDGHTVRATRAVEVVSRPNGTVMAPVCANGTCGKCSKCVGTSAPAPKAPCSKTGCIPQSGSAGTTLPKTGIATPTGMLSAVGASVVALGSFLGFRKKR